MNSIIKKGKVILAGAGPGDPDLLTIKAAHYLQKADIVLTDRLVSAAILERYVSSKATIVEVGKQCSRGVSTPQETINKLIVDYAVKGNLVVRLKGGDVSFFSNVLDELEALVSNNIPYEIIPGITAASGAAAYAGIPLTARNHAVSVRFLTYYKSSVISKEYWKELAITDDTLVFYMSSGKLNCLIENLIINNIDATKEIAVIEQATTPFQKVYSCNLNDFNTTFNNLQFLSPSLVIIGKVVKLHVQFNWFNSVNETDTYYFKPLTAAVETLRTNKKNIQHASRA